METLRGYEITGIILQRDLIVVKTCLCMFQLVPVIIQRINASSVEDTTLIIRTCFYVSLRKMRDLI